MPTARGQHQATPARRPGRPRPPWRHRGRPQGPAGAQVQPEEAGPGAGVNWRPPRRAAGAPPPETGGRSA
eukprot:6632946-Alexandrium_andersonii.AAC.1